MVQVTTAGQRRSGGRSNSRFKLPFHPVLVPVGAVAVLYIVFLMTSSPSVLFNNNATTMTVDQHPPMEEKTTSLSSSANKAVGGGSSKPVVAFAVSVTGCGSDPITEGAAVLKHSVHLASVHGPQGGKYDYQMIAIYHPAAESCTLPLKELGYTLLKRDVFVQVQDIKGDYLRSRIAENGCCGEKELIKLEAYTLTDYPIVVHLDLDVLVLKPLDELFDWMLHPSPEKPNSDSIMWPEEPWPSTINAFFTMDYNMVFPHLKYKPVQGGFLVLRPSMEVYNEFRQIVLEGDFRAKGGWGGKVGPFYGSMTFQGIIPYYYSYLHPGQSVEVSRCIYNQMCDNPRTERTVNDVVHGDCRTGTKDCEDCRSRPVEDVVTTHFTLCQKPWLCHAHPADRIQDRLCRKLTTAWYRIRSDLEQSWGRSGAGSGDHAREVFFGYCTRMGHGGYLPIEKPYGATVKK